MQKKKKGKGWLVLLVALLVLIPIGIGFLVIELNQNNRLELGKVTALTLIHGEERDELTKKEDIDFFVAMAQSGEAIETAIEPLENYRQCKVVFHKLKRDVPYVFYLSNSVHNCLYTDSDGQLFVLPQEKAQELLLHPLIGGFAVSYAARPTMSFTQGGETFFACAVEGEWYHAKANTKAEKEKVSEKSENSVVLPQGEAWQYAFSIEPDYVSVILKNKDTVMYSGAPEEMPIPTLEQDTELTLLVKAEWYEETTAEYHGSLEYEFAVFYDIPTLCQVDKSQVKSGDLITLTVKHSASESIAVSATFATKDIQQVKKDDGISILIMVAETATAGDFEINVLGSDVDTKIPITILETK